jgi:peptidoglycan/xylan/chitin deacetylase (PgdA/CDA1 family)
MYHRITDDPLDFWDIAVSPARFGEHLDVLRRTRHPLPLADFVRDLMAGSLPSNAVALTFDDGYVDNLLTAKPRLMAADVPATVYIATGFVGGNGGLWWDELARRILLENGPSTFELVVCGRHVSFDLGREPPIGEGRTSDPPRLTQRWREVPRRQAAIKYIWKIIRGISEPERGSVMVQLRSIFPERSYRAWAGRVLTEAEVCELVADGLVAVGAHSVTHPVLSELDPAACHREILESKHVCETLIGAPVMDFAYPYGDFDAAAREAVKTAGFAFACCIQRRPARATSDTFALPRIHVSDLDGDAFERTLRSASAVS